MPQRLLNSQTLGQPDFIPPRSPPHSIRRDFWIALRVKQGQNYDDRTLQASPSADALNIISSLRPLAPHDRPVLDAFPDRHRASSMFLHANVFHSGLEDGPKPFLGIYMGLLPAMR